MNFEIGNENSRNFSMIRMRNERQIVAGSKPRKEIEVKKLKTFHLLEHSQASRKIQRKFSLAEEKSKDLKIENMMSAMIAQVKKDEEENNLNGFSLAINGPVQI